MKGKIFLIIILICSISAVSFLFLKSPDNLESTETFVAEIIPKIITKEEPTARLVFGGDVMLSRSIGIIMKKENNYLLHWEPLCETFSSADVSFINLEGPISDKGKNVGSIYSFRADPKTIVGLTDCGIDVVSFANNHVWDWGRQAFEDTLNRLEEKKISYVGAGKNQEEARNPIIYNIRGINIAYLAYTDLVSEWLRRQDASPAVAGIDLEKISMDIQKAKSEKADIIITSFHFGDEYETVHNSYQEKIARAVIDAGANIVIGHHPHVAQDIERYNDGIIFYSLGNLIFDQNFSEDTSFGLIADIVVSKKGIVSAEKIKAKFDKKFVPEIISSEEI